MVCCLFGSNPLSEPVMVYYQLDSKENISVIFYLKFKSFQSRKCKIWKYHLQKLWQSCLGLSVFIGDKSWPESMLTNIWYYFDGLVEERPNSRVLALELHLSCTNPSIYCGLKVILLHIKIKTKWCVCNNKLAQTCLILTCFVVYWCHMTT